MPVKRRHGSFARQKLACFTWRPAFTFKLTRAHQWNSGIHYEEYPKVFVGLGACALSTANIVCFTARGIELHLEMEEITPLASLSLTHVHYNPNDPISYFCAWLALVPQGLCVVYATLIWSAREAEIMLMFAGQMGCEALNFALKRLIKEERPKQMYGKGYGMPSSHAQFVAYFSISLMLFLIFRHTPPKYPSASHTPLNTVTRLGLSTLAIGCGALVAWSRIYLNYHTLKQVLVGCAAGTLSAVLWFIVTTIIRKTGLLAWILDTPLMRIFRVRDLVIEEDLCQAGWEKWEERRWLKEETVNGKKVKTK